MNCRSRCVGTSISTLARFLLQRTHAISRGQAERFAKMSDRGLPEILEAPQYFVRCLAHLADGLQTCGSQDVLNPRGKLHLVYWRVVRKFWSRIKHIRLAHFPFAFSAVIRTRNFPISLRISCRTGPGGSLRAVFNSFTAIASRSCISDSVRSADLIGIIFPAPSAIRFGEICLCRGTACQ